MTIKNIEAWRKAMVRKDNGDYDYEASKAVLKQLVLLQRNDQERVRECVEQVFMACKAHQHLTKPNIQTVVKTKLAPGDMSVWAELDERTAEVLAKHYKIERKSGVLNPYFEAPPPDSRQAIAAGNYR